MKSSESKTARWVQSLNFKAISAAAQICNLMKLLTTRATVFCLDNKWKGIFILDADRWITFPEENIESTSPPSCIAFSWQWYYVDQMLQSLNSEAPDQCTQSRDHEERSMQRPRLGRQTFTFPPAASNLQQAELVNSSVQKRKMWIQFWFDLCSLN